MNLLMLSRLFPNATAPTFGQFNLQLAQALRAYGPTKVISPLPAWPPKQQVPDRTDFDGLQTRYPRYFAVPLLNRLIAGQSVFRACRREHVSADILLSVFAWPDGYAAVRLGQDLHLPVIVNVIGSDIDLLPSHGVRRRQTLFALQHCQHIYSVTNHLRDRVIRLGIPARKISVIHNGIDPTLFYPRDQRVARQELGLTANRRIITYVGWIEPDKGIEYLLRAHAALHEQPLLALVGEPPPRCGMFAKQMHALAETLGIADRCRFIGAQPHAQIATWMNAADVFAFPSLHEGCPNVVLEALACGLPMVATNVGGIPEITPRAPWCELIPPRNATALEAALDRLLAGSWDRQQIAHANRRTWDDVARNVYGICQSVVSQFSEAKQPSA